MKIVWICHFSSKAVQDILCPSKRIEEIAGWITSLAEMFEGDNNIELHIISPHEYISKYHYFKIRGIHYHFLNAHIPLWGRHWPRYFRFDYYTHFFLTNQKIKSIINVIKPDIIHLHGAENAYISSSVLQFRDLYPVLITIQGFISQTPDKSKFQIRQRIKVEQSILTTFNHFGYRTCNMGKDILNINTNAKLHWHHYPFPEVKYVKTQKQFDIVYFARLTKDKGIEDLILALTIIIKKMPNVRLCVIGGANSAYTNFLKKMANDVSIDKNITWTGFLPTQKEVLEKASTARISVLPTYHDIISGTIIESMFLKLPVIAYNVGSIYEVNEKEEIITLVKKGDIDSLADKILALLKNERLLETRAEQGYLRAIEMFDNRKIKSDLNTAYSKTIEDFQNG